MRDAARRDKQLKFTALLHHINVDLLRRSYYGLKKQAAAGVDGVTWQEYGDGLEERLADLHGRIHRGAYHAKPSRRVWIPKPDGRQRPDQKRRGMVSLILDKVSHSSAPVVRIAALEDKIVQAAAVEVLNQIWEEDFLGLGPERSRMVTLSPDKQSHASSLLVDGFRPRRSQHDALDALCFGITSREVNYVVDLDIRSFFDKVGHDHMEGFVRQRIGDERFVRLILKWLRAGVMEDGKRLETKEGTPQGAVISPLLANLYLHYVLDLWAEEWRKKRAFGDVVIVRYADDAVLGFQHRKEAERFLADLRGRVAEYGLEMHPEKTRLIEFGRYAAERRAQRGEGKPETFNFLGFTHICGKHHQTGRFMVYRKTIGKRMAAKLKDIRQKLRQRMHGATGNTAKWLQQVVCGYQQYFAVPGNEPRMKAFRREVLRMWIWQLRRRSQRTRWTWERFQEKFGALLPQVEVHHPYPEARFALNHPQYGWNIRGKNRVR